MKFVIIGGDAAGMSAASRARRNNPSIEVTVLEQGEDVSYSACGMPYNIADPDRDMDDLTVRSAEKFLELGISLLTGRKVTSIDRENRTVSGITTTGEDFTIPFDRLLIATGSTPVKPDLPGFDLPGVMALKTLEDGRRLKSYILEKKIKKAVILGLGYIGLEMAEALRELDIEVKMIKRSGAFLPWMPPEMAAVIKQEIDFRGVITNSGCNTERIEITEDGKLLAVCPRETFEGDIVITAIGVKPNSQMAMDAGLETGPGGAILVNRFMQTSDPDIYAAGDCATAFHIITGKPVWIPLALTANRGGWAAADHICGKDADMPQIAGTSVFKVFDLEVSRTGFSFDEAVAEGFDPVEAMIKTRSRAHAYPGATRIWVNLVADRKTGMLLGGVMVGREGVAHRINALAAAIYAKMTASDLQRCDFAYAPPFGPVWDPLLTAANQLLKKMVK